MQNLATTDFGAELDTLMHVLAETCFSLLFLPNRWRKTVQRKAKKSAIKQSPLHSKSLNTQDAFRGKGVSSEDLIRSHNQQDKAAAHRNVRTLKRKRKDKFWNKHCVEGVGEGEWKDKLIHQLPEFHSHLFQPYPEDIHRPPQLD